MFDYSYNFMLPCKECTAAEFKTLVTSERVRRAVAKARECEAALRALAPDADDSIRKHLEAEKARAKKSLPELMFQATFIESENKLGRRAKWRNNKTAVFNGLFIIDVDHVDKPLDEWQRISQAAQTKGIADIIMLAFVTASGHGLKFVCKAAPDRGGIAENQQWLCSELGIAFDEACKDAARISFCPSQDDILFINPEIFTYDNEKFRQSEAARNAAGNGGNHAPQPHKCPVGGKENNENTRLQADMPAAAEEEQQQQLHTQFRGVPYTRIIAAWDAAKGGPAAPGERHHRMQQMAVDFRHICDMDCNQLLWVMRQSDTGREIDGRQSGELENLAAGAVRLRNSVKYPAAIVEACKSCGIELDEHAPGELALPDDDIDYDYWWRRLRPLLHHEPGQEALCDPYAEAVAMLPDHIKLGGVLAAGAMLGTYLSRCWFDHYDGESYRLSYMVYVVGAPASGKSFIIKLDKMLMREMKRQDEVWREKERMYAEQKEKNEQTKGAKESKVMAKPHFPIRYVPSTISNHVLYNRLRDAVVPDDGSGMHLHLFTLESELATALRAQVGSWAGKLDLELKSFQNEYAGVDFANTGSANGLIQINWNQVISTTADSLMKKVRGNINDGYITRLALWVMPDAKGRMIPCNIRHGQKAEAGANERFSELCKRFETLQGCLPCDELVRCAYEWCEEQCEKVNLYDDSLVDYFRNRIPLYMVRYTLPRMVARDIDLFVNKGELRVTDDDKQFARLIGDWLMYISIRVWGRQLLEYWENATLEGTPRQKKSKLVEHYAELGEVFTFDHVRRYYSSDSSTRGIISLLIKKGYIEKLENRKWKKLKPSLDEIITPKDGMR